MNRRDILYVLLTSFALVFSFPPFPGGFFAIGMLVPFFLFMHGKNHAQAFRGGYLIGLIWGSGTLYWIGWATIPGLVGTLLVFACYFAFYAVIQNILYRKWGSISIWAAPFLWTGIEVLISIGPMAFPWNTFANTQTSNPVFIQYVSITGMYGVTFWVLLMNVLIFFLLKNVHHRKKAIGFLSASILLFIIPWIYSRSVMSHHIEAPHDVKISLVQGNIDPYKKWTSSFIDTNYVVYKRLTDQAAKDNPDLIVWPEIAAPSYIRRRTSYYKKIKSQIDLVGIPLVTGAPDYEWIDSGRAKTYNAAFLLRPFNQKEERYHKLHLVPFSEHVPGADYIPSLFRFLDRLDLGIGHYSIGDSTVLFQFNPKSCQNEATFGIGICYDSIFSDDIREAFLKGAQFLVIITNDGWFGNTSGPYQHAKLAVLRAIENRTWIARCANTGISEFIDPLGRIVDQTLYDQEVILSGYIALVKQTTYFTRHGSVLNIFLIIANLFILLMALFIKKREESDHS